MSGSTLDMLGGRQAFCTSGRHAAGVADFLHEWPALRTSAHHSARMLEGTDMVGVLKGWIGRGLD